jgi:hypothetical protein
MDPTPPPPTSCPFFFGSNPSPRPSLARRDLSHFLPLFFRIEPLARRDVTSGPAETQKIRCQQLTSSYFNLQIHSGRCPQDACGSLAPVSITGQTHHTTNQNKCQDEGRVVPVGSEDGLTGGLPPSLSPAARPFRRGCRPMQGPAPSSLPRLDKDQSLSRTRTPHAVARSLLVFIDGGQGLSGRSNLKILAPLFRLSR